MNRFISGKIILLLLMYALSSCSTGDGRTVLNIDIYNHPDSGYQVDYVRANFEVEREFIDESNIFQTAGEPDDIQITIEWWWQAGDFSETRKVATRTTYINQDFDSFTTTYYAESGYVLLNYYWVRIIWTDDDGTWYVESNKANCRYKKMGDKVNPLYGESDEQVRKI